MATKILSTRDYVDLAVSAHNLTVSAHPAIWNELNTKLDLDQTVSQRITGGYPFFTQGISAEDIKFDTAHTGPYPIGYMGWDANERCVSIGMNNDVILQVGKEMFYEVENNTGSTLHNGDVIMYASSVGNSGKIRGTLGISSTAVNPFNILGLATEDIEASNSGFVTCFGQVRGIDTRGGSENWHDGDILYVSYLSAGKMTKNIPPAPYPVIRIGAVINASANGIMMVRPLFHTSLKDLNDVDGTPLSVTGQIPVWDNTRSVFDFNYNITDYAKASAVNTNITTLVQNSSANWNSVYTTVQSNSATAWQGDAAVNSLVHANSANWSNDGFGFDIDGFGIPPTVNTIGSSIAKRDGTFTGWKIIETNGVTSNIVLTIKKNGTDISGTEKPTLTAATSAEDLSLSSWTTTFMKGDVITTLLDSVSAGTKFFLQVYYN